MVSRIVLLSVLTVLISGCGSTRQGADFVSTSQRIGPPKAGQGRVVVFRESQGSPIDVGWELKLDDAPMGAVKAATFVYADRPAGRHQLSSAAALFPGVSQRDVNVTPGRTYFFVAKPSDRAKALIVAQSFGGLAGYAVGAAVTSGDTNPGPVEFVPLDEAAAREAIATLQLAE